MRSHFLPYCLPEIGDEEIAEVVDSLRSGWVTTGPKVQRFEEDFARYVGASHAIALHSCTGALHLSLAAAGIGKGDEVIVPAMTFCATANVVVHLGAKPVLVDVDAHGLIDVEAARIAITPRTRAIMAVHFAGQSCDLDAIRHLAARHNLVVVEDAAHAVGATHRGVKIGCQSQAAAFSFYATKNMTTGEGGMVTTRDPDFAGRLRRLALHGMSRDAWKRYSEAGSWYYEVLEPGYKYNMTDVQAALGIHQLRRLDYFLSRRRQLAARYDAAFASMSEVLVPSQAPNQQSAYHLYPIRIQEDRLRMDRSQFIEELRREKVGASVHFIPLYRHPFYRETFGYREEEFPGSERYYKGLVSLPLYPRMTDEDALDVIQAVRRILARNPKSSGRPMQCVETMTTEAR